jgi:hypothetical protein
LFYFAVKNDSKFEIAHLDKRSMWYIVITVSTSIH